MATKQAHHVTLPIARDIATRNLWARVTPEHGSDFASIDIHVDDDGEEKLIEILAIDSYGPHSREFVEDAVNGAASVVGDMPMVRWSHTYDDSMFCYVPDAGAAAIVVTALLGEWGVGRSDVAECVTREDY